jgi:hypothetical protein
MAPTDSRQTIELKEPPLVGIIVCIAGGIFLFVAILMPVLRIAFPNPNAPNLGILLYVLPVLAILVIVGGVQLCKQGKVRLRLKPSELEFPKFEVTIPWKEIARIELVHVPVEGGQPAPFMALWLTDGGKKLLGNRELAEVPLTGDVEDAPDVFHRINHSFAPGANSILGHIDQLKKRVANAGGVAAAEIAIDTRKIPAATAALAPRDVSTTGPMARAYTCGSCGTETLVSDSALTHVCNPLRYVNDSICAGCGPTPISVLQCTDTGETVDAFRTRMWRKTPALCKIVQFLVLPAVVGAIVAIAFPAGAFNPQNPAISYAIAFGTGFLVMLAVLWFTPLAGIVPAVCGMQYHKYR